MTKTIFITGTSSGLGKLTATHFARQGWNVAATMRTPEKDQDLTAYENVKLFKLDVTDVAQVGRDGTSRRRLRQDRRSGQ
jgi:NAD(P)-dependent dehydrogenase (short-subunit alcohol dehydrogenase family)